MNDAELNLAIARLVYPDAEVVSATINFCYDGDDVIVGKGEGSISYNYCNNWLDLMPLVVEYGIEYDIEYINCDGEKWIEFKAEKYLHGNTLIAYYHDRDLQLALAKCLLAVLEAKEKS